MTYQEAMEYLERQQSRGMVLGLDVIRSLMHRLGDPQDRVKFIHVAGTNGKGSVCAFLNSVLMQAGYRVGRFLSPAVFGFCEQIQIDSQWIPELAVGRLMEQIRTAVEEMEAAGEGTPTMYELVTAMAFLAFAEYGCEYVVLETGLGGDEDATNVVTTTVCSVLTSISLDHTRILGETLAEIAGHKAGIFKPGVPVVAVRPEDEAAAEVIRRHAEELNCPLHWVMPGTYFEKKRTARGRIIQYDTRDYQIALEGTYQVENSTLAAETVRQLREQDIQIKEMAFQNGMTLARWHGRMEILHRDPLVIADGAHNPAGAKALADSLEKDFTNTRFLAIIGILKDKNYRQVLKTLLPHVGQIYAITPDSPRALSAKELAQTAEELATEEGLSVTVHLPADVSEAVRLAAAEAEQLQAAGEETGVLACGSLYYLGDLMRQVQEVFPA